VRYGAESLAIDLRGTVAESKAVSYNNLCAYRIRLGALDQARSDAREGLSLAREAQSTMHAGIALQHLSLIGALTGNVERAARLIGYVDKVYREEGAQREPTEAWGHAELMKTLHERIPEAELAGLVARGASWPEDRAAEEALEL
jgi:hypothetical protein